MPAGDRATKMKNGFAIKLDDEKVTAVREVLLEAVIKSKALNIDILPAICIMCIELSMVCEVTKPTLLNKISWAWEIIDHSNKIWRAWEAMDPFPHKD